MPGEPRAAPVAWKDRLWTPMGAASSGAWSCSHSRPVAGGSSDPLLLLDRFWSRLLHDTGTVALVPGRLGCPGPPGPPPQGGLLGDRGLRDMPRCGSQREGAVDSPQRVKDRHKRRCLGGRKGCRRVFDQGSCQNQRLSRGLLLRGHKAPGALVAPGTSAAGRRGWMQPGAGQRPAAAGGSAGRKHCLYLFIFNSFVFGSSPFHDVWQQPRPLLFCD